MTELSPGPPGSSICGPPEGSLGRFCSWQGHCKPSGGAADGEARSAEASLLCPVDRRVSEGRNAMARRNRITNTLAIEPGRSFTHLPSDSWARVLCEPIRAAARAFVVACLLCLGSAHGWAQQND